MSLDGHATKEVRVPERTEAWVHHSGVSGARQQ